MKILHLCGIYFLAMMVIEGTVLLTVDVRNFKRTGMGIISKKAHVLGWSAIIISTILFILRWMV
ncbi:MAG TPA: CLC_0170 family protein [Clostridium sp.]|uniref:CLC_0170 family protein n=1 Tax=Clostridium sp. TaxID=1506 RepID=UPI002F94458F